MVKIAEFENYNTSEEESEMLIVYARIRKEGLSKTQAVVQLFEMGYKPTRYILHCVRTQDKHIFF